MSLINSQVKSLKLNVTNIQSYLVSSNEKMRKLRSDKNNLIKTEQDKTKKAQKEKKIESSSSGLSAFGARVAKGVAKPFIGLFDRIKEFLGLIIAGIIVNNLPKLIEGITKTVSDISKTISQIGSFIGKNKWMLEGIKFMMTTFGVAVGPIIDLVKAITPSEQNRITKDSERIRDEFGSLDKDLEGDDEEINRRLNQYERNQARQTATTTPSTTTQTSRNTPTGSPDRSFREPSTPTRTDSRVPKFAAGGRVEPRRTDTGTQPAARKSMTAATTTGRQTDGSVRSKRAVQTVNYFSFFNNNTRASEAIVEKDAKNKDTFKEILTSLKTIQDIRKQIGDDDGRPSDDITGPGPSNEILEYDVTGGELPSRYGGRGFNGPRGPDSHGYPARDYQLSPGKAITVFKPGRVIYAQNDGGDYGNLVKIKHDDGKVSLYAHLSRINVRANDVIDGNGRVIGLSGGREGDPGAGNSEGSGHLHFEIQDVNGRRITQYNDGDAYFRFGTVTGVRRITGVAGRPTGQQFSGEATYYGRSDGFHGRRTSTGETFNTNAYTAAIQEGLRDQFGGVSGTSGPAYAIVENLDNGRKIVVKINDVGPLAPGRVIDLSEASSKYLLNSRTPGSVRRVRVTRITNGTPGPITNSTPNRPIQPAPRGSTEQGSRSASSILESPPSKDIAFYQQLFYIG